MNNNEIKCNNVEIIIIINNNTQIYLVEIRKYIGFYYIGHIKLAYMFLSNKCCVRPIKQVRRKHQSFMIGKIDSKNLDAMIPCWTWKNAVLCMLFHLYILLLNVRWTMNTHCNQLIKNVKMHQNRKTLHDTRINKTQGIFLSGI